MGAPATESRDREPHLGAPHLGAPRVTGIYMVGILPRDLGRSLAFYRVLGVDLTQDGDRLHFATRSTGGVVFFVNATGFVPASSTPRVALEFRLEDPAAVDEAFALAVEAGGDPYRVPELAPFGDYVGLVLDPDGNVVALSTPPRD